MNTIFRPDLKAHVSLDEKNKVLHVRHSQEYWPSEDNVPRVSAETYLNEWAETLQIPRNQLQNLHKRVSFYDPREQDVEYQLDEEKHLFDSTTVSYYQTYLNTPVWRRGLSVTIKQNPNRILGSMNNSEVNLRGRLPDQKIIDSFKAIFRKVAARTAAVNAGLGEAEEDDETAAFVRAAIQVSTPEVKTRTRDQKAPGGNETRLLSGKFFIYKYDPERRYAGKPSPPDVHRTDAPEEQQPTPIPTLPPVSDKITAGQAYLVAEAIFTSDQAGYNGLTWLILLELETSSILYIECMTCGVNGLVFKLDPMVKTGDLTITADDSTAALNLHVYDELLNNLDPPVMGTQHLRGTFVAVSELTDSHADPDVDPPTQPSGTDFDYPSRSDNFGAVNAYYHQTELFRKIESLGFPFGTYFNGTTFPIPVDHRALGTDINAHWSPNGSGGTGHMCYGLGDTTNLAEPLARAVDPWVHWHEMGGHGTLGDHVGSGLFGFAHSAGDGLAALQMDPESALRALPERFRYAPFRPALNRRFDRPVNTWAWGGGANDDGGYGSEQILATCHFRIYRSLGGDANDVNRRKFASRVVTYLILRGIGGLTPGTNPSNWDPVTMTNVPGRGAQLWCEHLMLTDLENWISEGLSGGAYNKVIRWAFEKQGSYQPAGTLPPFTTPGAPPAVDVYIDDGRAGEYQYIYAHWDNQSIWNRNTADGLAGHQNAIDNQPNYLYGKVKNRGTTAATNVTVRAFHTKPGAGLTWPNDFVEMSPIGGLPIASIPPNSTGEVQVGPFEWDPNINVYGHDCVLMIASVAGDPSNIDNFTGTESIQEWRLVPHDNNIAQRNVSVLPGAGGEKALMAALNGAVFTAGNNLNRRAVMELRVEMPAVLREKGWQLEFDGINDNKFPLKAGDKRRIHLKLRKGREFTKADIEGAADRMIRVSLLADGLLLGGMSYYVDPSLEKPSGGKQPPGKTRDDTAQKLLDCLNISGGQKVKKVCVKKVSVDFELENDCDCT